MNYLASPFPGKRQPLRRGVVDGIQWAIVAYPSDYMPMVNGYAQIPAEGHPWSNLEATDDIDNQIHAPGGLTWGPSRPWAWTAQDIEMIASQLGRNEPRPPPFSHPGKTMADVGGWIGFDTGHAGDHWSDEALAEAGLDPPTQRLPALPGPGHDWTVDAVAEAAQLLAHQIAAVGRDIRRENIPGDIPAR